MLEIGGGLVHLADVVHHPLHVQHPEWDRAFDSDPELAGHADGSAGRDGGARRDGGRVHIPGFARIVHGAGELSLAAALTLDLAGDPVAPRST